MNFALPICGFRLDRARPLRVNSRDGYQHFSCVRPLMVQLALKRLIDILGSAFGLFLLSPLMIVVAFLVKVTSRGAVFFRQERSGLHGRPFHMLKFRSMVADAEKLKAGYLAQERTIRAGLQAAQRSADHARSDDSCANTASMSCPSSSTCSAGR